MKLTLGRVRNGYILTSEEGVEVFEETPDTELKALQALLYSVCEALGYFGSKHDSERLFVEIRKQNDE